MLELAAQSYTVVKRAEIDYLAPARGAVVATGQITPETFAGVRHLVEKGDRAK